MDNFFEEEYSNNEWSDFVNSNYWTGYEDPTLNLSPDYFVSQKELELDPGLTTSPGNAPGDRVPTPTSTDHVDSQDVSNTQGFSV